MKKIIFLGLVFASFTALAQRTGKDYAVFFYITDFQPGWESLPETKVECLKIKHELEQNFNFICDSLHNPTKLSIREKIRSYNELLTENDQLLLFFSTHGHYNELSDRGYLVGADGILEDKYQDTWLSYDDLRTDLAVCKAKHVLIALDACHSGAFGIRNRPKPVSPAYEITDDCTMRITKMFKFKGRQYCTSGNKEARTPANSRFALKFLEALRDDHELGIVRFDDLIHTLSEVDQPRPENGSFLGHEPGGDFVLVKKESCLTNNTVNLNRKENDEDLTLEIAQKYNNGRIYLDQYPNGKYLDQAKEIEAWIQAKNIHTCKSYSEYKSIYCPKGAHCAEVTEILSILGCDLPQTYPYKNKPEWVLQPNAEEEILRVLNQPSQLVISYRENRIPSTSPLESEILSTLTNNNSHAVTLLELLYKLEGRVTPPVIAKPLDLRSEKGFVFVPTGLYPGLSPSNNYALFFNCLDYSKSPIFNNLPDNKLNNIAALLETKFGFQKEVITNPKKEIITQKLLDLSKKKFGVNDQVFLYFNGHGTYNEEGSSYYFVPVDGKDLSSYFGMEELRTMISSIQARHLVVVMDSTFGNKLARN